MSARKGSAANAIPPEQLERFARELRLSQAILVGWTAAGMTHVVTWGDSLTDSAQAGQGGNFVRRALGFPETLCRALSPRVAEALAKAEGEPAAGVPRSLGREERPMTAAERKALDALHAWLHHPHGDCDLIEECADFHEECSAGECELAQFAVDKDTGSPSPSPVTPVTELAGRRRGGLQ